MILPEGTFLLVEFFYGEKYFSNSLWAIFHLGDKILLDRDG